MNLLNSRFVDYSRLNGRRCSVAIALRHALVGGYLTFSAFLGDSSAVILDPP